MAANCSTQSAAVSASTLAATPSASVAVAASLTVQSWSGSTWITQATITGNNLVKRTVTLAAVTTDRIRINVTSSPDAYSYITEIEAWGN